ncbi:uncharacterized protein BJ212DRAFT_1302147 [Suillus subaureus]|uniref:Uncharacterized protein n=1 Tax=Suillus subaureus TaxID=48587 RepID=A0A9P7JAK3_9AGAM|nr:uncharacterized protein BJ212DRAFT_1302147 [Suillus subaureus]KAG1811278.1 hypothetical protein BJ212DRAFT_1302147 [Suillus subaureus]
MAPSNNTSTASLPVASTSSPSRPAQVNQGSFPVASIIILAISIIGMGVLVVWVFLQHRSSARIKQSSSEVNEDEPRPFNRLWSRILSKSHLWRSKTKSATKHKQGEMTTVSALHATCTFVAAAPSKILAPPVVMQFRVPDAEKFVVLCSVGCSLSAHYACGDPKPWVQSTFVGIPHLAQEQLPVNNQPSSIPERQSYSVDIPPSDQDHSLTIELPGPFFEDQPRSPSVPPKGPKRTLA